MLRNVDLFFGRVLKIACLFAATLSVNAQNFGEINGTVTDSFNATVATAMVTITNTATNVSRRVQTNDTATIPRPFFPLGRITSKWNMRVSKPEFAREYNCRSATWLESISLSNSAVSARW